ncbi:MAG: nitroreductase family protein [Clostridia bacterium]
MDTLQALRTRRSTRVYTDAPVARATLETILDCARYAPSAMNGQRWQFTVVTQPEHLQAIALQVRNAVRMQGREVPEDYCCFYHAPVLILVSLPRDYAFVREDGACALENIFLAAHSLGLGSCWINQLGARCDQSTLRALLTTLGVPEAHVLCGCAAIGHAAALPTAHPRAENTIHFA